MDNENTVSVFDSEFLKAIDRSVIIDSLFKAESVIRRHEKVICSISGGSDSDVVLDLLHRIGDENVIYVWFDTGLEYKATKEHLDFLEQKYNVEIRRVKAAKPIPLCVKQYGLPFISKYVSEQMMRLQAHGFKWEDEPLEVLLKKYPNCKTALQWWCNAYYSDERGVVKMSRFSINRNRFLKEFIMLNPPDFPISNKCCEYAKKKPAKKIIKEENADLDVTGIRQAEGGVRAANYKNCYSKSKDKNCDTYRPLFWYSNSDKKRYDEIFGVEHSRCYSEYGLIRTGCVGCPLNPRITEELEIIRKYEPSLYNAAVNIFGKSYEYTKKYREFAKMMKSQKKC